ncbi:MAG TPA: Crp/Fnr family transcriptional regulator, partial [Draconibacterium sp.]|nr:Crp/Fnr family transcriptional regulator [Draconibacterium sp.]
MDFVKRIKTFYNLSESDVNISANSFKPVSIPAKTYFLKEGKIADQVGFIKSGLFRSFFYDDNANDITTHFFQPGTVLISMKSFNNQKPAKENIISLGDSEIFVTSYQTMQKLFQQVPVWRQITKDVDEMKFNELMNRSIQLHT